MNLLVDTQSLIWASIAPGRLTVAARDALDSGAHRYHLSLACVWEIAIKVGLGKLDLGAPLAEFLEASSVAMSMTELPITRQHALLVTTLPHHHGDPFDRMLIAQSIVEGMPIVSNDTMFARYGIEAIW